MSDSRMMFRAGMMVRYMESLVNAGRFHCGEENDFPQFSTSSNMAGGTDITVFMGRLVLKRTRLSRHT